jgi:hypothetical protein
MIHVFVSFVVVMAPTLKLRARLKASRAQAPEATSRPGRLIHCATISFALDECELTERGLSTPAVEKIVQARSAPRPSLWSPGRARKVPEPTARGQALLRRLVYARRIESVPLVKQVCGEIEDLAGVEGEFREQLEAAVRHAGIWLVEQDVERRKLFDNLKRAVAEQRTGRVRRLLIRVNATAAGDRMDVESAVYERAVKYFESLDDLTRDAVEAEADTEGEARRAAARVRSALNRLRGTTRTRPACALCWRSSYGPRRRPESC